MSQPVHDKRLLEVATAMAAAGNVVPGPFALQQPPVQSHAAGQLHEPAQTGAQFHAPPHPSAYPTAPPASQPQHALKKKHLDSWTLVKRARFNAAKRLERKSSAGIVTLAIVALYGGLISVFNLMFKHRVGGDARDILEYVAVVSSWLTLIIGLTEQQKGHSANARELHDCARDVNNLQKHLAATPIYEEHQLQRFLAQYSQILDRCRPNHDDIDYTLAETTISKAEIERRIADGTWNPRAQFWRRVSVRTQYHFNTYWFYVAIWIAPPLVGLALWHLVPATPPGAMSSG